MPEKIGNVELYMGPKEVGGPDNLKKAIVDFIDGAEKRLYIAVQELDIRNIQAVIVLNTSYLLTLKQMQRTLAHEFGHHWTLGYMLESLESPLKNRAPLEYNRMRGLTKDDFASNYSKGWHHCDKEVLAEDYKHFFSPFKDEHRMKNLVGNPSDEVSARIWDFGFSRRRS